MPLYEYVCEEDGSVIELVRPMSEANAPVEDPAGKGRRFVRKLSTFSPKGARPKSTSVPFGGGCCPCGKSQGACGTN